jgi:hypothetical protein
MIEWSRPGISEFDAFVCGMVDLVRLFMGGLLLQGVGQVARLVTFGPVSGWMRRSCQAKAKRWLLCTKPCPADLVVTGDDGLRICAAAAPVSCDFRMEIRVRPAPCPHTVRV